jgi:hypothetical protein
LGTDVTIKVAMDVGQGREVSIMVALVYLGKVRRIIKKIGIKIVAQ